MLKPQVPKQKTINTKTVTTRLLTTLVTKFLYFPSNKLNFELKPAKNLFNNVCFLTSPCVFLSIIAQIAGVNVSATIPDKIIAVAIVTENCR